MTKVIVDIETIGKNFFDFEEKDQQYLLKYAKGEEEQELIRNSLALHAVTGEIVTIGMLNPETKKGIVFFQNKETEINSFEKNGIVYESGSEKEMLEKFWKAVLAYDQVVTFNGRSFDIPYLMMRSAINQVRVSRNLMGYRYASSDHCDLMEQFTFHGVNRRFSLDFYAQAFGIESSKKEGIDGSMVGELYREKRYSEVAEYCARDLQTTGKLYEYWDKYLKF